MGAAALPKTGAGFGNYLIAGIEEVTLPPAISWWPQTLGWKILSALLLVAISLGLYRALVRWYHNRYRRDALRHLRALERRAQSWQALLAALPPLLKAVALQAYPRTVVASLSGREWLVFLDKQCAASAFSQAPFAELFAIAYRPQEQWQLQESDTQRLLARVRRWIKYHRADLTGGSDA